MSRLAAAMLALLIATVVVLQGCGTPPTPDLPEVDCAGGCHLHPDCHDGHVHYHGHDCAARASDPPGTCDEVAVLLTSADGDCLKSSMCCEATNFADTMACDAATACGTPVLPELPEVDCAGGCHLHPDCHDGHVHYHGHGCAASASDPPGTCDEVAILLKSADGDCLKSTMCCEATNSTDTTACDAAAACGAALELPDVDCAGGCHLHPDCHNGHVHYHGHGCAASASDPPGTCDEVAELLTGTEGDCLKSTMCCEATDSTDTTACDAAAACDIAAVTV